MRKIKAYKCDFCRKKYFTVNSIKNHEKICFYNYDNKSCGSCLHNDYGNCDKGLKKNGEIPKLNCNQWLDKELNNVR